MTDSATGPTPNDDASPACLRERLAVAESRLEAQARQQRALMQGISHDLRAPLRSIDSFALLLDRRVGEGLDATARDHLDRIRAAASRMGTLLEALQQLVQAEHAVLRYTRVDMSLLADWVGAELQDAEPGRAARIEVAPELAVDGDEHWLKAMLQQVMRNAWAFSRTREQIEISVAGASAGDRLQLRVSDRGIGFDPRYADKLFEPFQCLHGADEGAGAGLGLAIAHTIVRRHGGQIHAESRPGEGSVFQIDLPLSGPQAPDAHG